MDIELADGAGSELALLLRDTIARNIADRPQSTESFRRLRIAVLVRTDDTDTAVTLDFKQGGRLRIYDGEVAAAHIRILGDTESIRALTSRRPGLRPDEPTRLALKRQLGGELTIRGLVVHPAQVRRLLRVLAAG